MNGTREHSDLGAVGGEGTDRVQVMAVVVQAQFVSEETAVLASTALV